MTAVDVSVKSLSYILTWKPLPPVADCGTKTKKDGFVEVPTTNTLALFLFAITLDKNIASDFSFLVLET